MSRDDFPSKTKEILAKRVTYLCSNPDCQKPTVGPNSEPTKSVSIGVAAHITAASKGGKRYDETLTSEERSHIDNGIWLCASCSVLIDRDETKYTTELLHRWKDFAEQEAEKRLTRKAASESETFLEIDLLLGTAGRRNVRYSTKNPIIDVGGMKAISISNNPIVLWEHTWNFKLVIFNNSEAPAFNLCIKTKSDLKLSQLGELPKINNLAPLGRAEIDFGYNLFFEGTGKESKSISQSQKIDLLNRTKFELSYQDSKRVDQKIIIGFDGETVVVTR